MTRFVPLFFLLCLAAICLARTFSRRELVRELRRHGLPEHLMKDFVCLVEAESCFQTHVVGGPNTNGSYDYGLFQINDMYWCNPGNTPGKGCNVRCEDLLSDNIAAAVDCAKIILAEQGLTAWVGWVRHCEGRDLPELNY